MDIELCQVFYCQPSPSKHCTPKPGIFFWRLNKCQPVVAMFTAKKFYKPLACRHPRSNTPTLWTVTIRSPGKVPILLIDALHHLTDPIEAPRDHVINPLCRTRPHLPTWSAPTTPDCTPWTFPHRIEHHHEIISWNAHPRAWLTWPHPEITCASRDNRATTHHLHHLVGRPLSWWTWALRVPTLILSNLFLSYCVLILL